MGTTVKRLFTLFITFLALTSLHTSGANLYVSDQLFTYMHSGSSAQFRIVGSVNAGTAIRLLQHNKATGYSKVVDTKGRTGWIDTKYITKKTPAILRLPQVEEILSKAQSELKSIGDQNKISLDDKQNRLSQQIKVNNQLIAEREQLSNTIKSLQLDNIKLQTRITNQSEEVQMQWLMRGAGVIIMGIFIGLVVPHLPRRKKKNDTWG
jgi:SH3 domain protein